MKIKLYFILLLAILSSGCKNKTINIYVSPSGNSNNNGTKDEPFNTLETALESVQSMTRNEDDQVTIHILEGDYHLSSTLLISSQLNNIAIIGAGTDKVTVKGSKIIDTKWAPYNENILVTSIDKTIDFNQLFINGEQQILARYPNYKDNGDYWQGYAADAIDIERTSKWENPEGGFLHAMHKGRWGGFHYEIVAVTEDGDFEFKGGHQNNRPSAMHPEYRMVENVFEELDSEKEWYFDKTNHKLYVWKSANTDLANAKIEVSVLKHLIEIKGSVQNPVKNVSISGINFQHVSRTFMEQYHQLLRSDWTIYRGGALFLDGTENITINDCEFTKLGGNVIFANAYNRNLKITGNQIYNCGASAISFVGDSTAVRSPSYQYNEFVPIQDMDTILGPKNKLYPSKCLVENNLIYKIGRVEKQVAGVQISMAMKIHVKNNSIYDVPRAGINVSEGTWGGHLIEYNDVFNTVLETSDHGSFNSWGRDRFWHPNYNVMDSLVKTNPKMPLWDAIHTTTIRNNRFKCDHGWDIDLDDGSTNYEIYNNLCLNRGVKLREGYYRVVKNNIMVNNTFHPHVWFSNSEDVFTNNIVMKKYADIRLQGWGKEIDFNLFPTERALQVAQKNGTDVNSSFGDPLFTDPKTGDFSVKENSPALKIGFTNFTMNNFGVQKPALKAIAKQPKIPSLRIVNNDENEVKTKSWFGATLKEIETIEEQSSYGTHDMDGVIIMEIDKESELLKIDIKVGDVIIYVSKEKIKSIPQFIETYNKYDYSEHTRLTVVRNQKEMEVLIKN